LGFELPTYSIANRGQQRLTPNLERYQGKQPLENGLMNVETLPTVLFVDANPKEPI
jgi:hypothetical protein